MHSSRPSFKALPLRKHGPAGNAWGLFGDDDELGMLNLLTVETTRNAAKEIFEGTRISIDLPLDRFNVPAFGRQAFHQELVHKAPRSVNDDILTFNTQASSQWDGFPALRQVTTSFVVDSFRANMEPGYQNHKLYFNGCRQEDFSGTNRIGIHVWAENGGITGRGVLLDYQSWAESEGLLTKPLSTTSITLAELHKVSASQNVTFEKGDILFIRSGYGKAFGSLQNEEALSLVSQAHPPAIGVESAEATLEWIWETGFAAVAGDMPSFEAWPCQNTKYFMHEWLLAGWGMPIGELFNLERLSIECRKRRKWTFFFSSMPLKVPGGVASPPNGVAIL